MSVLGVLLLAFAPTIVGWFSDDAEILRYGTSCLRIMGIGYPAYAAGMIVIQALNGAGDTRSPSIMNFLCFWVIQIPLAYWLAAGADFGPDGVFIAIVISETLLTLIAIAVFRSGRWQQQEA